MLCQKESKEEAFALLKKNKLRISGMLIALCVSLFLLAVWHASPPNGWVIRGNDIYYYADGSAVIGWLELDGRRYYFAPDGIRTAGWQEIGGEVYYFDKNGAMVSGWLELDGGRCYLRSDGSRVTGWLSLGSCRYYLDTDGRAATGFTEIDGATYLFDADGKLAHGLTVLPSGTAYADQNGHPVTGWVEDGKNRYYFHPDGIAATGWTEIDGTARFFRTDGRIAAGAVELDGQTHYFSAGGLEIILVNAEHFIPQDYKVTLSDLSGGHKIADFAFDDLTRMLSDCRAAGFVPAICSSYRTQEYQENLFAKRVRSYTDLGYTEERAAALAARSVALPGTSEHQLGLALDIVDNANWHLDESQAQMPAQQWLMRNSWKYGFILRYPEGSSDSTGIIYEPWHYRYVGREISEELYKSGLCLEDYLRKLTD